MSFSLYSINYPQVIDVYPSHLIETANLRDLIPFLGLQPPPSSIYIDLSSHTWRNILRNT